jgi:squalene-hopene/tetraprenyl-beta-curcumene cyclase
MKRRQFLATTIAFGASAFTRAADEPLPRDGKNLSFRNEIRDSLNRSLVWLRAQQNADGSFGKDTLHPALTALPLIAFQREPTGRFAKEDFVAKGYAYLRGFTQPDGGIYSKENGLANYNTSVCLLALVGANEPKDLDTLVKARAYVVGQQAAGMAKPETDGGIGYGSIGASPKRGHPDLDNTVVALEALRATKHLIADKPGTKDLNWNAAIDFVARCQNLPSNKQPWASADADNKGGFIYYPGFSNAGEVTLEGGGKALRSYGSMSYAGLLSFIYADVKSDDPRVTAAVAWLRKHYTLDENPGLEKSGYFYYLHLMAKGLTAAGITELEVGGKKSDWRLALAERLMKLQQQDGSWLNDTARWKENNPVLVTTYCALTLEILYAQL